MSAPEVISDPLAIIDSLFEAHQRSGSPVAPSWGERQHFVTALGLDDERNFSRIPCINEMEIADLARPNTLVRFRGMIQDLFEPEIFVSCVEEYVEGGEAAGQKPTRVLSTKYREILPQPAPGHVFRDPPRDSLGQRGACYMVPMPAESAWAREASAKAAAENATSIPPPGAAAPRKKRGLDDGDCEMESAPSPAQPAPSADGHTPSGEGVQGLCAPFKKGFQEGTGETGNAPCDLKNGDEFGLNLPLPWEERRGHGASVACIVKLYDDDAEAFRLCDTVEILGVLCVNPELANLNPAGAQETIGMDARNPSTALVPRLHAIVIRKLPYFNPLLPFSPSWLSEARLAEAFNARLSAPGALLAARAAAIAQLRHGLFGDALAAEYALMVLVARSFGKHGEKSLGTWSLNYTGWPKNIEVSRLHAAVAELVPRAVLLTVTTASLNSKKWKPIKDFGANRLVAGQLQLAPGTALCLDETELNEGQLNTQGCKAVGAISSLVLDRTLPCDFAAYDVKVPIELACVLVSRGKSIVKDVDCVVPVRQGPVDADGPRPPAGPELDAARLLIGLVTRNPKPLQIPDDVKNQISEDFAAVRGQLEVPTALCHTWMGVARAMCLTYGDEELTMERWRSVLQLEKERLGRCKMSGAHH